MALSWNEITYRALNFSKEMASTLNEETDAKPFLVEFFTVFGISSKRVSFDLWAQTEKTGLQKRLHCPALERDAFNRDEKQGQKP